MVYCFYYGCGRTKEHQICRKYGNISHFSAPKYVKQMCNDIAADSCYNDCIAIVANSRQKTGSFPHNA